MMVVQLQILEYIILQNGDVQDGHFTSVTTAADGEVWVIMTSDVFTINGNDAADADDNVYGTDLTARK